MKFREYQHIERFSSGVDEIAGIELGTCYIFPKIDGTNASIWQDGEWMGCGSRRKTLSYEDDNSGFYKWAVNDTRFHLYLERNPQHRLYGEWLVPHSLKTYREDAWRKFYVFDVVEETDNENHRYLTYEEYQPLLEEFNIDYIIPIAIMTDCSSESLIPILDKNTFLIDDGKGAGEGIVIKNYGFRNRFGKQVWAKIVRNEFREKHIRTMGPTTLEGREMIERKIVDKFCSSSFIEKEYSKIVVEKSWWDNKLIPMLLGRVYSEFIKEELWMIVKEFKMPIINFKTLNAAVIEKIKLVKPELFSDGRTVVDITK